MSELIVQFDGGCRPTNPGNKYGSYAVKMDGNLIHSDSRFELGWGTNNEAEFEAFLRALQWIVGDVPNIESLDLLAFSDSMILVNRINRVNTSTKGEPAQRMAKLTNQCHDLLDKFGGWHVEWNGRECNVQQFGH